MNIKIIITNLNSKKSNEYNFLYDEKTTILDLRKEFNIQEYHISLEKYYLLTYSNIDITFNENLPFIINNNIVKWNVELNTILVKDFIKTHDINDVIYIEYWEELESGLGGGIDTIFEIWKYVWQQIHPIVTIAGEVGGAIGFFITIKNIFKKKIPSPHNVIEFLYKRKNWNHIDLSENLNTNPKNAKNLLKAFGYRWDNSKKLYTITQEDIDNNLGKLGYK